MIKPILTNVPWVSQFRSSRKQTLKVISTRDLLKESPVAVIEKRGQGQEGQAFQPRYRSGSTPTDGEGERRETGYGKSQTAVQHLEGLG